MAAWLLLPLASAVQAEEPPAAEPNVSDQEPVEENLFLMRLLDILYGIWLATHIEFTPDGEAGRAELRRYALDLKHHAEITDSIDPQIAGLYQDLVASIEAHEELGRLAQVVTEDAVNAEHAQIRSAFGTGTTTAASIFASTGEGYSSLVMGILAAALKMLEDSGDHETRRMIEDTAWRLDNEIETRVSRFRMVADAMTEKYGWSRHEPYVSDSEAEAIVRCFAGDDPECLARVLQIMRDRRPRDPLLRVISNYFTSMRSDVDVAGMLALADDSLEATQLVPPARVYDRCRMVCIENAAQIAADARSWEIAQGIMPLGSTAAGAKAVELRRLCLEHDPTDSDGWLRMELALQLLTNNELQEALQLLIEVMELRAEDPLYLFLAAGVKSRLGEFDDALALLKEAIQRGMWDTPEIREHPYFLPLRGARREQFDELLRVRASWDIDYGWLSDDITLTNNSAFSITDVLLKVKLQQDEREWNLELSADEILPGQTHRWPNVVSIPGDRLTESSATVECYENRN